MVLGFSIILPVKLYFFDRVIRKKTIFSYLTGTIVSLLLIWYLVGMISFGKKEDLGIQGGFGLYGMNLNSFYNAAGYSRFLPSFKHVSWHQYEGFMYLGIGGILLVLIALATRVFKNPGTSAGNIRHKKYRHLPLVILLFIYASFSITHIITFNDKVLMAVPVPGIIMKLGEIFRASSRFFWVIYYLMLLSSIVLIARSRLKNLIKYSIIIIAVSIQLIDTWPLLTSRNFAYGSYIAPIDNKNWNTLINEFDEIAFYPALQASNLTAMDYQFFCYLAAKAKKPINTGYVARFDNHTATVYSDSLQRIIIEGKLSPRTLYITTIPYLTYFTFPVHSGISQVNTLDNYYYFFTQDGKHQNILPLVAELNSKNKMAYDTGLNIVGNKNRFEAIPKINSSGIKVINYSIPKLKDEEQYMSAGGWAFIDTSKSTKGDSIFLTLNNDNRSYLASTMKFERPDLVSHFNKPDLINAGFNAFIFKDNIEPGSYTLGILIKSTDGKTSYQATENTIKVGQSLTPQPKNSPERLPRHP
jgi:hypothetical protein